MKTLTTFFLTLLICPALTSFAQTSGDFRTRQNGDWNNTNTWQRFNGSSWVNAAYFPTYSDNVITVLAGHTVTVTATVQVDQTIINGAVIVNSDPIDLDINDGTGTDLQVFGTITNYGDVHKESASLIVYESGSKYIHARNGGTIETASWNANAECQVTGVTSTDPLSSSYNQAFGSFTWNCPSQSILATTSGNLTTINGNFRMKSTGSGGLKISTSATTILTVGGKFVMTGGIFILTDGSADNLMIVQGDSLKISGGTLTENGSQPDDAIIRLSKSGMMFYEKTGGLISGSISFEILSGCTLDLGTSILGDPLYSSGYFTLNSGAGLKTQHSQGISTSSSTGCVQMISTKTYSNSANYTFYRNGSQASGNGFQTTQNGLLTVGSANNASTLTLTNGSVLVNNKLVLFSNSSSNSSISGTVSYGASGILEYQGASSQTTANGEFPASGGPYHLIINNGNGVSLHASRSLNGTLYLTSGAFSIGANTLTLNGPISISSGSLTGGSSSSLTFGGTGSSTNLPAIILNNLTINRASGVVMSGSVTTGGTLTLQNGNLSIGSNTLTINGLISKTTGTLTGGNTSIITFGGSGAATGIEAITLHTLTLNRSNGLNLLGNLTIKNQLNLISGALNIGNYTIFMDGIINRTSGSLNGGSSSNVEIRENASSTDLPSVMLNNLTINRATGVTMSDDVAISGTLYLSNGNFSINSNTLTLSGFFSITSGELIGGPSSNLIFEENLSSEILPVITLNELTINRSGGVFVDGDVTINGNLTINDGTLKATNKILTTGGNISVNSGGTFWIDGNSQLKISAGKTVNVNDDGKFMVTGDPSLLALVTQNSASRGFYGFSVNENGVISAQYGLFEYMNLDGIYVAEGALVDESNSFDYCTFQQGEPGGQLLTIDNNEDIVIHSANFPENTWGSDYNAGKSIDAGNVYFEDVSGLFAGEVYENDPFGRINWPAAGITQELSIPAGWSGISTCIIPGNPKIEIMFQPIVSELVLLYNLSGSYWPDQGINTLKNWDVSSGYIIKTTDDVSLIVSGYEISEKTVALSQGWNLIPVYSLAPASEILESLPGFVVAKGIATGEILWPALNINTLDYLNTGKAYYVYTTQAGSLTYPDTKDEIIYQKPATLEVTTPWNELTVSPNTHLVAFGPACMRMFEPGDYIGAFTETGLCAGAFIVNGEAGNVPLIMMADDPTTSETEGFTENSTISFRYWRKANGETFALAVTCDPLLDQSGLFVTNGLSAVTDLKISASATGNLSHAGLRIFPNPSQGAITIESFGSTVKAKVFNSYGEEVYFDKLDLPAKVDLSTLPRGIYFIRIESDKQVFFEKLIIN